MATNYDEYYQTENLFGEPNPELVRHYSAFPKRGTLLDVGCGQGRDAIALARLGFEVTGLDHSQVGIDQLNAIAAQEELPLTGIVADIYAYQEFGAFDFLLLDSMFHFGKRERDQETGLLRRIFRSAKPGARITICIQNSGQKVAILNDVIAEFPALEIVHREALTYVFVDKESGHSSETLYEMVTVRKSTSS